MGEVSHMSSSKKIIWKRKHLLNEHTGRAKIVFADNEIIIGSNQKIKTEVGWSPQILLKTSLNDVIKYWENELK